MKNAEIKKSNAQGKAVDNLHGDGSFVPKDKVKYTPAELAAKKKIAAMRASKRSLINNQADILRNDSKIC